MKRGRDNAADGGGGGVDDDGEFNKKIKTEHRVVSRWRGMWTEYNDPTKQDFKNPPPISRGCAAATALFLMHKNTVQFVNHFPRFCATFGAYLDKHCRQLRDEWLLPTVFYAAEEATPDGLHNLQNYVLRRMDPSEQVDAYSVPDPAALQPMILRGTARTDAAETCFTAADGQPLQPTSMSDDDVFQQLVDRRATHALFLSPAVSGEFSENFKKTAAACMRQLLLQPAARDMSFHAAISDDANTLLNVLFAAGADGMGAPSADTRDVAVLLDHWLCNAMLREYPGAWWPVFEELQLVYMAATWRRDSGHPDAMIAAIRMLAVVYSNSPLELKARFVVLMRIFLGDRKMNETTPYFERLREGAAEDKIRPKVRDSLDKIERAFHSTLFESARGITPTNKGLAFQRYRHELHIAIAKLVEMVRAAQPSEFTTMDNVLMPYQVGFIERITDLMVVKEGPRQANVLPVVYKDPRGRAILAAMPGMGKTRTGIFQMAVFHEVYTEHLKERTRNERDETRKREYNMEALTFGSKSYYLVVVPATLLATWYNEVNKVFGTNTAPFAVASWVTDETFENWLKKTASSKEMRPLLVIVSIDKLRAMCMRKSKSALIPADLLTLADGDRLCALLKHTFGRVDRQLQLVLIDEVHTLKKRTTQNYTILHGLTKREYKDGGPRCCWGLSGTPYVNVRNDILNQLFLLGLTWQDDIQALTWNDIFKTYVIQAIFGAHTRPAILTRPVSVEVENAMETFLYGIYEELRRNKMLGKQKRNARVSMALHRLAAVSTSFLPSGIKARIRKAAEAKPRPPGATMQDVAAALSVKYKPQRLLAVIQRIKRTAPNDKILVFAPYKAPLARLQMIWNQRVLAQRKGYKDNMHFLDGDVPMTQRNKILEDFARPDNADTCRTLLMTYAIGGQGLNLQRADHVILLMPQYHQTSEDQAIARAARPEKTKDSNPTYFDVKEPGVRVYTYRANPPTAIETLLDELKMAKRSDAWDMFVDTTKIADTYTYAADPNLEKPVPRSKKAVPEELRQRAAEYDIDANAADDDDDEDEKVDVPPDVGSTGNEEEDVRRLEEFFSREAKENPIRPQRPKVVISEKEQLERNGFVEEVRTPAQEALFVALWPEDAVENEEEEKKETQVKRSKKKQKKQE